MRAHAAAAAILVLVCSAGAASAQSDACTSFKWPIARERQAFAGNLPALATGGTYVAGTPATVTLALQADVAYTIKPKRAPKVSPAYGAELTGAVAQPGTYQVTLSDDAWIDLAQGGKTLRSTDFSGKVGCPGLRKSVRFTLDAGPVTIAVSDAPVAILKLDLLPAE